MSSSYIFIIFRYSTTYDIESSNVAYASGKTYSFQNFATLLSPVRFAFVYRNYTFSTAKSLSFKTGYHGDVNDNAAASTGTEYCIPHYIFALK